MHLYRKYSTQIHVVATYEQNNQEFPKRKVKAKTRHLIRGILYTKGLNKEAKI